MNLHRQKYKAKDGTQQTAARWYLAFRDHRMRRRCWPLHEKKKVSEGWADKIDERGQLLTRVPGKKGVELLKLRSSWWRSIWEILEFHPSWCRF